MMTPFASALTTTSIPQTATGTQSWLARVTGDPSVFYIGARNAFMDALRDAGVYAKLGEFMMLSAETEQAARQGEKGVVTATTVTAPVTFAGLFGALGDGKTGFINTGVLMDTLCDLNDHSIGVFISTNFQILGQETGAFGASNNQISIRGSSGVRAGFWSASAIQNTFAGVNSFGLVGGSRYNSAQGLMVRDDLALPFSTPSVLMPATNWCICRGGTSGASYSPNRILAAWVGTNLDEDEWGALYQALLQYTVDIGISAIITPELEAEGANAFTSIDNVLTVNGATNNGSGLVRISTTTLHRLVPNDPGIQLDNVGGVPNANGRWVAMPSPCDTYAGDGVTTAFTISFAYSATSNVNAQILYANGQQVLQRATTEYSVSGATLTMVTAPPSGTTLYIYNTQSTLVDLVGSTFAGTYTSGGTLKPRMSANDCTPSGVRIVQIIPAPAADSTTYLQNAFFPINDACTRPWGGSLTSTWTDGGWLEFLWGDRAQYTSPGVPTTSTFKKGNDTMGGFVDDSGLSCRVDFTSYLKAIGCTLVKSAYSAGYDAVDDPDDVYGWGWLDYAREYGYSVTGWNAYLPEIAITGVVDNGSGMYRVTAVAHGLTTGNRVKIAEVEGALGINRNWGVTVIDANTFDTVSFTYFIASVTESGGGGFRITTDVPHRFVTGDKVRISGVKGTTGANADWTVTRVSATAFDLDGSTFSGTYEASGRAGAIFDGTYTAATGVVVNLSTTSLTTDVDIDTGPVTHRRRLAKPAVAISNVVDNGSGLFRVTASAHDFFTDNRITIAGVVGTGMSTVNATWYITVIDDNTFDLQDSTFAGTYTSGGTAELLSSAYARDGAFPLPALSGSFKVCQDTIILGQGRTSQITAGKISVSGAVNNGSGLVRLTVVNHGLNTGNKVTVASVGGVSAANGTWKITRVDENRFDLQGSTFAGTYTSGGNLIRKGLDLDLEWADGRGDSLFLETMGRLAQIWQAKGFIALAGGHRVTEGTGALCGWNTTTAWQVAADPNWNYLPLLASSNNPYDDVIEDLEAQVDIFRGPAGNKTPPWDKFSVAIHLGVGTQAITVADCQAVQDWCVDNDIRSIFLIRVGASQGGPLARSTNQRIATVLGLPTV